PAAFNPRTTVAAGGWLPVVGRADESALVLDSVPATCNTVSAKPETPKVLASSDRLLATMPSVPLPMTGVAFEPAMPPKVTLFAPRVTSEPLTLLMAPAVSVRALKVGVSVRELTPSWVGEYTLMLPWLDRRRAPADSREFRRLASIFKESGAGPLPE